MALIALRQLLDHAADHGYGVPAFNVNNLEQVHAIMQAAQATDSPVILQASAGARKYAGEAYLRHLVLAAIETHPDIPVCLHQDHGASPAVCLQAIRSGFSSVMMDGSLKEDAKTPADYAYNVAVTAQVCQMAHAVGVSVEGELGCLGSLETGDAGEEDGVVLDGEAVGRHVRAYVHPAAELDSLLLHLADTAPDARLLQLEVGDAEAQQAADQRGVLAERGHLGQRRRRIGLRRHRDQVDGLEQRAHRRWIDHGAVRA